MRLSSLKTREIQRKLKRAGFYLDRQAKGSHEIWYNPKTRRYTTIPNHPGKHINVKTIRAIVRGTGLTLEEFMSL